MSRWHAGDGGHIELTNRAVPSQAVAAQVGAFALAPMGEFLYYTTNSGQLNASYGIYRIPADGPADAGPEVVVPAPSVGTTSVKRRGIVASGNFIYWAEGTNIMALRPDGQ